MKKGKILVLFVSIFATLSLVCSTIVYNAHAATTSKDAPTKATISKEPARKAPTKKEPARKAPTK